MSKIKVSELFYSIQGEGRYSGVPSVFLRTFGCNFRCRNFGRNSNEVPAEETHNPEVRAVLTKLSDYKSYSDLPLVKTGCDSYAAVYPEFKDLSPLFESDAIAERIMEILPFGEWRDEHLVITGGEPLLGWQRAYPDLLTAPGMEALKEITFETNGTQSLTDDFKDFLTAWTESGKGEREVTFSVSAKLSCSGESREDAIKPDIVVEYEKYGYTYLKFVIATETDAHEAIMTAALYRMAGFNGPIYLMPVGGTPDTYSLNNEKVADLAMKHGLRYSDRLQVPLFKNRWGT